MNELKQYIGTTYSNNCQIANMTEKPETPLNPEIPKTIPDMGVERPEMDADMTYPKKKNIDETICQKPRKKDVYETDMHKIYNIIVVQKNKQLQEK